MFRTWLKPIVLLFAVMAAAAPAFGTINVNTNQVNAIYDYSNFSAAGSFTSIYNPTYDKTTRVYANMRVQGFTGTDGKWITESVTYLHSNGAASKTVDLISGQVQVFGESGNLTSAYTEIMINGELKRYDATIDYASNGSYTISWKGLMLQDANGNGQKDAGEEEIVGTKTVQSFGADGRLNTITSTIWDAEQGEWTSNVTTMVYDQAGNMLREDTRDSAGKMLSQTFYEAGRRTHTVAFNYDENGNANGSYTSARYVYEGNRMSKVESYSREGLEQTLYFDNHGRESYATDAMGREVSRWFYNDTGSPVTETVNGVTVTTVPGGILYQESYTYYGDSNYKKTDRTYFHNGSSQYAAISYTHEDQGSQYVDEQLAKLNQAMANVKVWTAYGDPTVEGKVYVGSDGLVHLEISSPEEFQKALDGIDAALQTNAQWQAQNPNDQANKDQGARLQSIKAKLVELWTAGGGSYDSATGKASGQGKIDVKVGAIDLAKMGGANMTGHMGADVNYTGVKNDALMKEILTNAIKGGNMTLTWDFWAIDSSGSLWVFAHDAQ